MKYTSRIISGLRRRWISTASDLNYWSGKYNKILSNQKGDYILEFHGIDGPGNDEFNWRFISEYNFFKLIEFLKKHGSIVPVQEIFMTKGNGLRFGITFDDGYKSLRQPLLKLSQDHIPVTLFITPNNSDERMLWTDQVDIAQRLSSVETITISGTTFKKVNLRYISENGTTLTAFLKASGKEKIEFTQSILQIDQKVKSKYAAYWQLLNSNDIIELSLLPHISFGAHGVSHTSMDQLNNDDLCLELTACKSWIEQLTNQCVDLLAFPCGRYSTETIQIARKAGYRFFLAEQELLNSGDSNEEIMTRTGIYNKRKFSLLISDLIGRT